MLEYSWIPDDSNPYDWQEAIELSRMDTKTATFPPQATDPITMDDIARVDAYAIFYHGERWRPGNPPGTELELTALLELKDGRWASLKAYNDYTGWGCQDGAVVRIGSDRVTVIRYGLTEECCNQLGV